MNLRNSQEYEEEPPSLAEGVTNIGEGHRINKEDGGPLDRMYIDEVKEEEKRTDLHLMARGW